MHKSQDTLVQALVQASVQTTNQTTRPSILGPWMKALRFTGALVIGLYVQGSLAQTTTTVNFDSVADGAAVTTQYSGLTISGATAFMASNAGVPSHSGANVAYAGTGLMSFAIGSSLGSVKTVSAYITGPTNVGIFAYDSANNLLGQSVMSSNGTNVLLTFTSSGNAIARLDIHDGGASFFVDDVSFVSSSAPALSCTDNDKALYDLIAALPLTAYNLKAAAAERAILLAEVVAFEKYRASRPGVAKLKLAMQVIQAEIKFGVKAANNAAVLQQINVILAMIQAGGC